MWPHYTTTWAIFLFTISQVSVHEIPTDYWNKTWHCHTLLLQRILLNLVTLTGIWHTDVSIISLNNALLWNLVVHWLSLCASTAGSTGSVPGRGTKLLQACCTAENKKNNNNKQKTENLHMAEGAKNKGLSWKHCSIPMSQVHPPPGRGIERCFSGEIQVFKTKTSITWSQGCPEVAWVPVHLF